MKLRSFITVFLILFAVSSLCAEMIDITPDLQKKTAARNNTGVVTGQSAPQLSGSPADPMTDINDIKPPEDVGFNTRPFFIGGAILGVLLLILLFFFFLDRYLKGRKGLEGFDAPLISPDEEALQRLDMLEKEGINDPKEFYYRLTGILKAYIGRRYNTDAPEMTTEELVPVVSSLDFASDLKQGLKSILTASEPVKYALATVMQEQMKNDFEFVRAFVDKTSPEETDTEQKELSSENV